MLKLCTTISRRRLRPCSIKNHSSIEGLRVRPNLAATCPIDMYFSNVSLRESCLLVRHPTHTSFSSNSVALGWERDMYISGKNKEVNLAALEKLIRVVGERQKFERHAWGFLCDSLHDGLKKHHLDEVGNADPEPAIR